MRSLKSILLFLMLLLVLQGCGSSGRTPADGGGETEYGSVSGHATDSSSGNPIAGATIQIGDSYTSTDADGFYQLDNIVAGQYSILASAQGYYLYFDTLQVSGTTIHNISMDPDQEPAAGVDGSTTLDFESSDLAAWSMNESKASIGLLNVTSGNLDGTGAGVLEIGAAHTGDTSADAAVGFYTPSQNWGALDIDFDFMITSDTYTYFNFYFYSQSTTDINNTYKIVVAPDFSQISLLVFEDGVQNMMDYYITPLSRSVAYTLRVVEENNYIYVYLDGALIMQYYDYTYEYGYIGFGASNSGVEDARRVYVDNITANYTDYTP